jgi:outer membrane protein assembly factor BamE
MRIKIILLSLILLSSALASCSAGLTPYKMDIRQGNFVTPDMREKLKLGMTRQQVRYVLGTPMINDAFHGNRWDYAYRLERDNKVIEKQDLTLYFEGDNLVRMVDGGQFVETAPTKAEAQK